MAGTPDPDKVTPGSDYVTRAEAIRMLEVKPATLYTYVSRGLVRRVNPLGRKQSYYLREDVDRIRSRSTARASNAVLAAGAIRYGEPIVSTSITEITAEGPRYRSRNAIELAKSGIGFEAVADLLWTGVLIDHHQAWALQRPGSQFLKVASEPVRLGNPVSLHDAFLLVTCAAAIAMGPPQLRMAQTAASSQAAPQLMLLLSGCFGYLVRSPAYRAPKPDETIAQAIAASMRLPPSAKTTRALDAALVLCADHELNPATFVARITASSESDLHSCIAAAIGAHSGARIARSCDWLDQFFRKPVNVASLLPRSGSNGAGATDIATLGFNHPLYPRGDPRAAHLLDVIRALDSRSSAVRNILECLDTAQKKHKQHARLETALALLAIALKMPVGAASGLITLARIAGWVAHIAEQRLGGFLIRPRAKFVQPAPQARGFVDGL